MALPNARNQYLKTQIETASKEQLVVMLFDGIIRFTEQARKAIQEEKIEESHHALMRAQAIVMELICTIDKEKGGEVATNLMSLHAYAFNCLIVCNMKKDISKIDEVQKIYRELRDAWSGAMDSLGIASTAAKPVAAPAGEPVPAAPKVPVPASATGKPLAIPKAPLSAAMPKPAPAMTATPAVAPAPAAIPAPAKPAGGPGVLAAAAPAQQAVAVSPAPAVKPTATGYGMGRTAMLGAAKPAVVVAPTVPASAQGQTIATAANPKQAAMLNAYSANTRSIA